MSSEIDLGFLENPADPGSQRAFANIFRRLLPSEADTPRTAKSIANEIEGIFDLAGSLDDVDGLYWHLWMVVLDVAYRLPPDHPWQDCLVAVIENLRRLNGPMPGTDASSTLLWKDLPNLAYYMLDKWADPTDPDYPEHDAIDLWKNQNSFAARITSEEYSPWMNFPVAALNMVLEDTVPKGVVMDCRLWVATEWILCCGRLLYSFITSATEQDESTERGISTGPLSRSRQYNMASTQPFAGKVIAITGAGSGIGRATAIYLAQRGASLAISDVNNDTVDAVAAAILAQIPGTRIITSTVDVSKADQVKSWIQETIDEFGKLDGAANIAGTGGSREPIYLDAQTDDGWNFVLDINLSGTMYCLREELRALSEGGSIVNTSSVLGLRSSPLPGGGPYVTSKHGVLGLTRTIAREYGHKNIRVNCVNPGAIATPMMGSYDGQENPLPEYIQPPIARWGTPEEVAQLIGFLLGDESRYISGTSIVIDGGLLC
ncbi:3-oxoacyl-acyl-carrier- reductase [Paramyrothecium foliicola]|nr:3-oxoacyl-acyl-carrier- reductase [Paramyrothecium foliicola]